MSDWDDDDFVPETEGLAPPPVVEDVLPAADVPAPQPSTKVKPKYMQDKPKAFNMEDLGRELTPKEREEIQRRSDLSFARDMFGGTGEDDDDHNSWEKIMTKDEFEEFGEKSGKFFATRHKAGHYGDFLGKILTELARPLDATEIRKMSNLLKKIADDKKAVGDKEKKVVGGATKGNKGAAKPSLKAGGGKGTGGGGMYDDYEGGGGGQHDEYDDFM